MATSTFPQSHAVPDTLPGPSVQPDRPPRMAALRLYVGLVIATGAVLLLQFAPRTYPQPLLALTLLACGLALSVFKVRLPLARSSSTMTMAYAVDFAALILVGSGLATVIAAAGALLQCLVRVKRSQPIHRLAFSVSSVIIAVQAAGLVWRALGGSLAAPFISSLVAPLATVAITYFAVNTALVAGAIALSSGVSAVREWNREFLWSAPAYFLSAAVAGMTAVSIAYGYYTLLPVAALLLFLSYRAYTMSVRRLDEERRHAQELVSMITTTQQALARATESESALAAEKEQLAITSARLSVTLRTISDGVVTVDQHGSIILLNESAQKLAGAVMPSQAATGSFGTMLAALGFSTEQCVTLLSQVLQEGVSVRLRNDESVGSPMRLIEVTGTPTRHAEGHVAGAVWVLRDITDIAQIEHERAKSARLESLGVLAGGLAHDFNNILMGITGNLSLVAAMVPPEQAGLRTRLDSAVAACTRARGVTNQLLTFAKGGAPVKKSASLRELVTECARFALSGSPVAPSFQFAPDTWEAEVDATQVGQVIQNLALNAKQAMPQGGLLDVSLDNVTVDDGDPLRSVLTSGTYVRLTVRDSGTGIPPELLARIFDPYFTTREKGSGLGLAISHSIIQAHGGAIMVDSEVGVGTTFTVYLPASVARVPVVPVAKRHDSVRTRTGRVLLMDDEDMVAEVAQEMFECVGYTVKRAVNGDEAIRMFSDAEQTDKPFDVVVLDLTVPGGMGGAEAVKYIREMRSDVAVVVSSGYADDSVMANFKAFGFDAILPKPFTLSELRQAMADLDGTLENQAGNGPGVADQPVPVDARTRAS